MAYARSFCPPNRASKTVGRIKRSVQSGAEVAIAEGLALERELQQISAQQNVEAQLQAMKQQLQLGGSDAHQKQIEGPTS